MILLTWNCCRGPHERKAPLLEPLAPDIAVIQECARPRVESPHLLWFGDNPRQGIVVEARSPYRLEALPALPDVPRYVVPVRVTGPTSFTLLAVWAKADRPFPYVEGVVRAVELYRDVIAAGPTVLMGDLNSNTIWDAEHADHLNHSALVERLSELDLVSAYHAFHDEGHGRESTPTYYFRWKEDRPYHLDYCFLPKPWMRRVTRVTVGSYAAWRAASDHRPVVVEVGTKSPLFRHPLHEFPKP